MAILIWASSFVLVKLALAELGPLTIAGLRYFLGFVLLLPFLTREGVTLRALPRRLWARLFLIGLSGYTLGNGALFWGLRYVPATTGALILNLTPLLILSVGTLWLREVPTRGQVVGTLVSLGGIVLFFSPGLRTGEPRGVALVTLSLLAFAVFGVLGREVARERGVTTRSLTAVPLALGGGTSLLVALGLEGIPAAGAPSWGIVLWLAAVNTALAYLVYNHALQVLTALEMNVTMNVTPLATAVLAWILLGEGLGLVELVGIVVTVTGVALVQWRVARPRPPLPGEPAP